MACTKTALLILTCFILASVMVARIQEAIHVEDADPSKFASRSTDSVVLDDGYHRLMHFIQVTDTHLSVFGDATRASELKEFIVDTVLGVIKPPIVVMTGDITDSVGSGFLQSQQIQEEWELYSKAISDTGVAKELVWLDMRGNHDNLNLADPNSDKNFYRHYSVQGPIHPHSYLYTYKDGAESYTFIGIDTCTDPGVKRPFNFIGSVNKDNYKLLQQMKEDSRGSNMTIWFGHHPTSSVDSASPGLRVLMSGDGPYLCGHYHTIGGLFWHLYTMHSTDFLELELADWKHNRMYRVAAIDHGLFSFIDVRHNDWPVILITNPKNALLTMPGAEPVFRIRSSSHVRVLVYSPKAVVGVTYSIDGGDWITLRRVDNSSLWVAPWQPELYEHGLHNIVVRASHNSGFKEQTQPFSIDGSRPSFPLGARFILMQHIYMFQGIFAFMVCLVVLPLIYLKIMQVTGKVGHLPSRQFFCSRLLLKLNLLVSINRLFWPVILLPLYACGGPWFVGELVDGHTGVCFIWGLYINGFVVPSGFTYVFASLFMLIGYLPFVLSLASLLWQRRQSCLYDKPSGRTCPGCCMIVVVVAQTLWAGMFVLAYGYLALVLGFLTTGAVLVTLFTWRKAINVSHHELVVFENLLPPRLQSKVTLPSKPSTQVQEPS
ncbi:transmembrane protein 62-like [Ornithodoros turicata]|uniref:Putative conserved plasma membrane protein n=1 Tax=Ornithodoros turicata TaxID=34597 RepID=A0A2R5LFH0_9ACAR